MTKPGPRRKPTNLKMLSNKKFHGQGRENEPQPDIEEPDCPEHLTGEAVKEWNEIVPILKKNGLITRMDKAMLAAYCQAYGTWVEISKTLQTTQLIYKNAAGNITVNPLIWLRDKALGHMMKCATQFGLSPSSRSDVSTKVRDEANPYREWQRRKENAKKKKAANTQGKKEAV